MYAKVFERILTSSIMDAGVHVRWLWIVLLVMADRDGYVIATETALARIANMPVDDVRNAIAILTAPDQNSTNPEHEGRRVLPVGPNTWWIPGVPRYRAIRDADEQRAETKERVRRWRAANAHTNNTGGVRPVDAGVHGGTLDAASTCNALDVTSACVTRCNACNAKAEAEAKAEANKRKNAVADATIVRPQKRNIPPTPEEVAAYLAEIGERRFTANEFCDYYTARGWRTRAGPIRDWQACVRTWVRFANQRPAQVAARQRTAADLTGVYAYQEGYCASCGAPSEKTICEKCQAMLDDT